MTATQTFRPVSEGQRSFITSLLRDRDVTGTPYEGHTPDFDRGEFHQASAMIDYLKTLPFKAREQAAEGYYVLVDGTAVKVQANKAGTGTYALVWSGGSWEYERGLAGRLVGMEAMTGEQAARLGLASGKCICCLRRLGGESLTARVSAVIGYGEICAGHQGWAYPKGAAAQRAFLADAQPSQEG